MDITYLLIVLIVTTTSMILHELMHGVVAYLLGDDTAKANGRLTLNPLKHLDPFMSVLLPLLLAISGGPVFGGAKPVPIDTRNLKYKEWGFALVAVAGPVTNILLAFIGFLIGHFTGLLYAGIPFWSLFMSAWISINLGFAIFNMIPIPPLDGSRVLYAIAPDFVRNIMAQMERFGMIIVFGLVMIFGTALSSFMSGAMDGILTAFYWIIGVHF
ncbi:MAG: site-2 protease family protein [Candidatus Saccharimonadales bacterium]